MAKENVDAAYPNLIKETPEITTIGVVPPGTVDRLRQTIIHQAGTIHSHYLGHEVRPSGQKTPITLQVYVFDDDSYRSPQNPHFVNGINIWRRNYISRSVEGSGLLVNASVLQELPDDYPVVVDHEIRHLYLEQVVGKEAVRSSFSLREGCTGLCVDSTRRLLSLLEAGEDNLCLPLSITSWDSQLDKIETARRCFINNPWYLSMFSFFHDFVGVKRNRLAELVQLFPTVSSFDGNLELAWKITYPGQPTLRSLQEEWLREEDFSRFRAKY